jgi:hypothetical protein
MTLGNACCHSAQNPSSYLLLYKTLQIEIYTTVILFVVLYGCEAWPLTLMEELRVRAFLNGVLRRVFGQKRDGMTEG